MSVDRTSAGDETGGVAQDRTPTEPTVDAESGIVIVWPDPSPLDSWWENVLRRPAP
ncbi:hypothetical protein ACWDUM_21150 [Rhodococcus sp. NPDC003322]